MARAHFVKAARKAIPESGIKVGDSYYWWKFRYGGKRVSKTPPRRSQLTQSDFLGQLYDIEDELGDLQADDTLQSMVEDIAQRLHDLASECEDKRNNMPEQLQDSESGTLLQERYDACEAAADELEQIDWERNDDDFEEPEREEGEDEATYLQRIQDARDEHDREQEEAHWNAKLEEVQAVSINV